MKNRKREGTEPEPQGLVPCSYSADKEEEETTEAEPEPEPPLLSRALVRCSSSSSEKEEEKNKYEEHDYSLKPLITTVTKTTIDTTSITIITPPEDPWEWSLIPPSTSWKQCPPPFKGRWTSFDDYALICTENQSKLCVFTSSTGCLPFNLTTAQWERTLRVPVPSHPFKPETSSTSVGVGHFIFKFHNHKLYALDSSSLQPSFERVPGLDKHKLPKYWEVCGSGRMVYLGKGKLCIVWGRHSIEPHENRTLYITCLMFWIGMCNRRNRLRAVIDRYERFIAYGCELYEVIAI